MKYGGIRLETEDNNTMIQWVTDNTRYREDKSVPIWNEWPYDPRNIDMEEKHEELWKKKNYTAMKKFFNETDWTKI